MGVQVTLKDIASGFLSAATHTANNTLIESGFDKTLDRTASVNNAMEVDLDMGSNKIINMANGIANADAITLQQLNAAIASAGTGLIASQRESQTGAEVVGNVTTFLGISYSVGGNNLYVFRNGIIQTKDVDYAETTGNSITWLTGSIPNITDDLLFITNLSTTNSTTSTAGITHNSNSVDYNLEAYLRSYPDLQVFDAGLKFNDDVSDYGQLDYVSNSLELDMVGAADQVRVLDDGAIRFTMETSTGDFTATGDITAFSDKRLKNNLVPISDALDKVKDLCGHSYYRIDTGVKQDGLIAQDVESVLPNSVKEVQGALSVNYNGVIALLVNAVNELSAKVEELEKNDTSD